MDIPYQLANRFNRSIKSTNLIDYEKVIDKDLVPEEWRNRHYKLIHLIGENEYLDLVDRAKKFGKPPARLLAFLVGRALKAHQPEG